MGVNDPQLSRVRTVLLVGLSLVWFAETHFLALQSLARVWAHWWQVPLPRDPQLATALLITWGAAAPAKGALCVMAVWALVSKDPRARTALYASMALVPPLNIAFPFRQQGFLLGPTTVGAVLSTILWASFFLFPERASQPPRPERPLSRQDVYRYGWFGAYSAVLTVLASLMLFWPRTALKLILPCVAGSLDSDSELQARFVHTMLAAGTHMTAVAAACWAATVNSRGNATLRRVLPVAAGLHAGLFVAFPLRQILQGFGAECASSSILVVFVPLFLGWVLYLALSARVAPATMAGDGGRGAQDHASTPMQN